MIPPDIDTSAWSGEGEFTAALLEVLKRLPAIALLRVEDAPASRAESGYNFLSNEVYVGFRQRRTLARRRLGLLSLPWPGARPELTLEGLERILAAEEVIGPADFADKGMLQYLRTERIIPPYQTRGYKVVELVRLYELDAAGR